MRTLTYKERLFVEAYLGEAAGNATKAARQAGYAAATNQALRQLARELLTKLHIRAAIDARLDSAALTSSEILARLSDHASASLEDFIKVTKDGRFTVDLKQAKQCGKLHTLKKLKEGQHGIEIELHDPLNALDKLAKYRGLLAGKTTGEADRVDEDLVERAARIRAERSERKAAE